MAKTHDPLAGLIEQEITASQKADRWAGRLLQLTLLLVFADIAFFIIFMLANVDILPDRLVTPVLPYWTYLGGATVASVLLTLLVGILKMSYEMSEH
ncbi:hypothetical protein [Chitinimonas sp. BJYL2]|uniref:hypothetical protein n=1 Tax=Chitinimonas sp. BJYL2 TaxID=2976696 RepID=UPI0022B400DA|nr:hypothetical protein [Chitinimonas sp. BJYL2]